MSHVQRRRESRQAQMESIRARQEAQAQARAERLANTVVVQTQRGTRRVSKDSFYGRKAVEAEAAQSSSVTSTSPSQGNSNRHSTHSVHSGTSSTGALRTSDNVQFSQTAQQASSNPFDGFAPGSSSVTVKSGDSLSEMRVAQCYSAKEIYGDNGALAQVMKANPDIRNADLIFPGQSIKLPSRTESAGGSQAAAGQPVQLDGLAKLATGLWKSLIG